MDKGRICDIVGRIKAKASYDDSPASREEILALIEYYDISLEPDGEGFYSDYSSDFEEGEPLHDWIVANYHAILDLVGLVEKYGDVIKDIKWEETYFTEPSPVTKDKLRAVIAYYKIELTKDGGFTMDYDPDIDDGLPMTSWIARNGDNILSQLRLMRKAKRVSYLKRVK